MRKLAVALMILMISGTCGLMSQETPEADIYLLTCGPGTETYSIYGHSAIRIVMPERNYDQVYNWGVFDFATPNFAWKFAKGRLQYMLGVYPYESFLREYESEKRWVISQKINLSDKEKQELFNLISLNLRPENIKYRYDFFYDNCSTRIRDLLEKACGGNLIYPDDEIKKNLPSFRELISDYQKGYPWMKFGIDLLLGASVDKKATLRDRMFLPIDLQTGLSSLSVRRDMKMIPLLQNSDVVLKFSQPELKEGFFRSPLFALCLLLIIAIIISAVLREKLPARVIDIFVFSVFSILAVMMAFFNFFSEHQQLSWNLNIIWLNPFILVCLSLLILNKSNVTWFRLVFWLAVIFLIIVAILPQKFNNAVFPLTALLILRSSARAGFSWNPFTLPDLT
jgi:hypothetical protein